MKTYRPMKMEQTECFETSAYKIQTPGNCPEQSIQLLIKFLNICVYSCVGLSSDDNMRTSCWMRKLTNTLLESVIFVVFSYATIVLERTSKFALYVHLLSSTEFNIRTY
jgi:hypothetical protein